MYKYIWYIILDYLIEEDIVKHIIYCISWGTDISLWARRPSFFIGKYLNEYAKSPLSFAERLPE